MQSSYDLREERRAFSLFVFWDLDLPCVTKFHVEIFVEINATYDNIIRLSYFTKYSCVNDHIIIAKFPFFFLKSCLKKSVMIYLRRVFWICTPWTHKWNYEKLVNFTIFSKVKNWTKSIVGLFVNQYFKL